MRLLICGDFTTDGMSIDAIQNNASLDRAIVDKIKSADYSLVNLESPVVNANCLPIAKEGPHLETSPDTVQYLKSCGFDGVALANNHFRDYGEESVRLTIETAKRCGLDYVGGGNTNEEKRKALINERLNLAILNYCETEFSVTNTYGSNPLDIFALYHDIKDAREKVKHVVVYVHGGSEEYNLPSPRMQKLYRYMIDLGAEAVVNCHQHCYSGYEKYGNGFIVYGLGNFFFHDETEQKGKWTEGYMVGLDFNEDSIESLKLFPYIQCANNEMYVRPMEGRELEGFQKNIERLNRIISDDTLLHEEFNKWCDSQRKNYLSLFTPYNNRYLRFLCKHGLLPSFLTKKKYLSLYDKIMCESHRDIILHELRKKF